MVGDPTAGVHATSAPAVAAVGWQQSWDAGGVLAEAGSLPMSPSRYEVSVGATRLAMHSIDNRRASIVDCGYYHPRSFCGPARPGHAAGTRHGILRELGVF